MALILPKYYGRDKNPDPGPWYVVRSESDTIGTLEVAEHVVPVYRCMTLDEAECYIKKKAIEELYPLGYKFWDTKDKNMKILKYYPDPAAPVLLNTRKQYVIFGLFSKKEANAMKFVGWSE